MRELNGIVKYIFLCFILVLILAVVAYVFYPQYVFLIIATKLTFYAWIFAIMMPFVFILYPATKRTPQETIAWYDILLAILTFGLFLWIGLHALESQDKAWTMLPPLYVSVIGIGVCGLLMEAGRRSVGAFFSALTALFFFIPFFAHSFPPPFTAPHFQPLVIPAFYIYDPNSILGVPIDVVCKYVVAYMIFGATLQFSGGAEYFLKLALLVLGGIRGGVAKVSIVASCLFGMLSGSAISNIITTGVVTIPAMKKSGYTPHYAGAVEACASTGGIIMPPVMGAIAFIMAEFTGIPYFRIALAAFIPGFLYYFAIFVQTDLQAIKLALLPTPKEERYQFSFRLLSDGIEYLVAAAILVYLIFWPQLVQEAPFFALLPLIIGAVVRKRFTPKSACDFVYSFGKDVVKLAAPFACIGLVIGSVFCSGLGLSLSNQMLRIAENNLLAAVLLTGITALILGMGLSPTAVYILIAIGLCPALVHLGFNLMAVHLFTIYYASVGMITPPVALAALVAARIAKAEYFKTGLQACRLGIVMFLVPFYFVNHPALVLQGTGTEFIISFAAVLFAVTVLCAGFERHMYIVGKMTIPEAIASVVCGLLVIFPLAAEITRIGWFLTAALIIYWIVKFLIKKVTGGSVVKNIG